MDDTRTVKVFKASNDGLEEVGYISLRKFETLFVQFVHHVLYGAHRTVFHKDLWQPLLQKKTDATPQIEI